MLATEYDFPDVRLPWDARDTHAALRALGRLRVNELQNGAHAGLYARKLCRHIGYTDFRNASSAAVVSTGGYNGTGGQTGAGDHAPPKLYYKERRQLRADCFLTVGGRRPHIDARSITRERSLMVPVNGKLLSVDDIVYAYEQLFEVRGMHSDITFMGVGLQQHPLDAFAIGDLLWRVRPRLLIELGTSGGGGALYYARIMRGYDPQAHVLTIDPAMNTIPLVNWNHREMRAFCPWCKPANSTRTWRQAVTYLRHLPSSATALGIARAMASNATAVGLPVLVVEDSDHVYEHVRDNIEAYASLVSRGSYLIVQDTRAGRFPGPTKAIAEFLLRQKDFESRGGAFVRDRRPEHFLISQHSGGFLRRLWPNERPGEFDEDK
jgi:cephalosporin hydroxylase